MEIAHVSTSCDHSLRHGAKDKDTERSLGAMRKGELECGSPQASGDGFSRPEMRALSCCWQLRDKAAAPSLCSYLSSAASAASAFSSSSFFRRPSFSSLPYKSKISNSNTWVILF